MTFTLRSILFWEGVTPARKDCEECFLDNVVERDLLNGLLRVHVGAARCGFVTSGEYISDCVQRVQRVSNAPIAHPSDRARQEL